jgi:hypothetical protein
VEVPESRLIGIGPPRVRVGVESKSRGKGEYLGRRGGSGGGGVEKTGPRTSVSPDAVEQRQREEVGWLRSEGRSEEARRGDEELRRGRGTEH